MLLLLVLLALVPFVHITRRTNPPQESACSFVCNRKIHLEYFKSLMDDWRIIAALHPHRRPDIKARSSSVHSFPQIPNTQQIHKQWNILRSHPICKTIIIISKAPKIACAYIHNIHIHIHTFMLRITMLNFSILYVSTWHVLTDTLIRLYAPTELPA